MALPNCDPDKAFAVQIAHEENVTTSPVAYVQCALLFTSSSGERRIRVHTLSVPIVQDLADLYNGADAPALACLAAKLSVERCLNAKLGETRDMVHSKLVAVLKEYRLVNSSSLRQPGNRLVFPHNLRLLPLLIHGLIRSSGLRGGFKDTLIDDRMVALYSLMEAPIDTFVRIVYPTVYVLHDPSGPWGQEVEGRVPLPSVAPASALFMAETGAYLIDNGVQLLLWLGRGIAREWCVDVSDLAQILSMRERTD